MTETLTVQGRTYVLHCFQYNIGNTAQFKAHGLLESYSVSLPKKSRQGDSLTSIYLCNLTKNLTSQSAHLNYAVLPIAQSYIQDFIPKKDLTKSPLWVIIAQV